VRQKESERERGVRTSTGADLRENIESKNISLASTGWRSIIGCLIFIGHFPQNSPMICGSLAENDLQLKASFGSSPPCKQEGRA